MAANAVFSLTKWFRAWSDHLGGDVVVTMLFKIITPESGKPHR